MATAKAAIDNLKKPSNETIIGFSPESLKAPFALRIAALCVDYLVFLFLPVTWLVLARFFSDSGSPDQIGTMIWFIGFLLFVGNSILLPMARGQSLGKIIFGMHIVKDDGARPDIFSILMRNAFGYLLTLCSAGLGFMFAALSSKGRALHDLVAGTMVVRGRKEKVDGRREIRDKRRETGD
jgi:uncharacterized RDD family membrane protein YckC